MVILKNIAMRPRQLKERFIQNRCCETQQTRCLR